MTTTQKIEALKTEALAAGDAAQAELCDRVSDCKLYDSETNDPVDEDDLDCTIVAYVDAICESLDAPDWDHCGHVLCAGRCVYAR